MTGLTFTTVQFLGGNSRLSLSATVVEHGIRDILFIHGKRTIPVQCARLFLERFSHSQSKHRCVLKVLIFPPLEVLNQWELQKGGSLDEVRLVVQWCEWMTVYGERAAANQSIRLICSPFLRESARKHIVSMTTRGWTIKTRFRRITTSQVAKLLSSIHWNDSVIHSKMFRKW